MQNLWDTAKSVIKRKYIALSTFIRREESLKNKQMIQSIQIKKVEKEQRNKPHDSMTHEGNTVRKEINAKGSF